MKTIRLMHNLPRTGGTIISKCLGAQKDVALLSEIHPNGNEIWKKLKKPSAPDTPIFDPIYQAKEWNGLFNVNEYEMIKNSNFDFLKKIELIYEKAEENNKNLIIRDWAFVDFFGIPFTEPTFKNLIFEKLNKKFNILNIYILRHPLELYISCYNNFTFFKDNYQFDFFIEGYQKFIDYALMGNVFKYEDFRTNPEKSLENMCKIFNINFDKEYLLKLNKVTVSGDPKAANSTKIEKKENIAQSLIKGEDKYKINNHSGFIKLMKSLNGYYQND